MVWAASALGPAGAGWLTTLGLGEWTAAVLVAGLGLPGLASGCLHWWFTGKIPARRARGHAFVLVFVTGPLVIFLMVAAAR